MLGACFALAAVATVVTSSEADTPTKAAAADPRPVLVLKAGDTQTVQWCWGQANGRAEMWFVTADGVLPKGWKDGRPSQVRFEQDGVRFELDVKASHRLSNELFKAGPYTAQQKTYANTFVTAAVVRVSAKPAAAPGGRRVVVHNISGTGYNLQLVAELRVVVTPKD
jgi:hypothetical protein